MILRVNNKDSYSTLVRLMTKKAIECENKKLVPDTLGGFKTPKSGAINPKPIPETSTVSSIELSKIRAAQKRASIRAERRRTYERLTLNSYLSVCVDVGQINRAFNLLLKHTCPKPNSLVDVHHYNTLLRGWAKLSSFPQIVETRMHMIRNNVEPNEETFAYILLGYPKGSSSKRSYVKKLVNEMKSRNFDPRSLFQATYLNPAERKSIKALLKSVDPKYDDVFCPEPVDYDCKLMDGIKQLQPVPHQFCGHNTLSKLEFWAECQRVVENKSSVSIKSVAHEGDSLAGQERNTKLWHKIHDSWRKALSKSLDESLEVLQDQCATSEKVHLYPYLCSVDKGMLINLMLDEVEINASSCAYSTSTNYLHSQFGSKVMIRYMKSKAMKDGSHFEKQRLYNDYLKMYCTNPNLMGSLNSREYFQTRALETKNYAIYRDRYSPVEEWPQHIITAIGKFLYGIILREIKFDPDLIRKPKKELKDDNLVHAFYTAYFQINGSHKIKEEFRAHQDFERLFKKCCAQRLRFDYSFLPTISPPMPWLSHGFGGYLTNKSDLVRIASPFAELSLSIKQNTSVQKLYPTLDSLNALGLCPWIVNKEILDIVIDLFRSGGDESLKVPLAESKMALEAPQLAEDASKADKILHYKQKKRYTQKKREMYSLWRDCLYRLSIANHFRDKMFWFPHNVDFRGRTYPIPPHFNHLGSDLARSLLLFAKGQPLGEKGLDWLKIHLINLTAKMKSSSLQERLDYANSILHLEVLDSADNPWDGRKWWTQSENPWQVLACCKEIAKAIRSRDFRQYISHFPIHQDGSCNGLQHYAALGRDIGGAQAVNLVPFEKPQDVYSRVVDIVETMRKKEAEKGVKVAEALEGFVQRKVIKQTVMTTVYGVTRYGARQQIARQLVSKGFPEDEVWRASQYLASKTFESIGQMFRKSRLIQDWFNECAYIISSKHKQPVSWSTPLGFPVTQPYTLPNTSSANRLLSTSIATDAPLYNDPLSRLNSSKQKTAFPPNYIHSLDSSHMMLTSLHCQRRGITFVSVHDCYWTHPDTVDEMNRICRHQFVALHSEPLLQQLSDQFMARFGWNETGEKRRVKEDSNLKNSLQVAQKAVLNRHQESVNFEGLPRSANPSSSSIAAAVYDNQLVNEDLKKLLEEEGALLESEDGRLFVEPSTQPQSTTQQTHSIVNKYAEAQKMSQSKSKSILMNVPESGDLDLNVILNSTYFFS